MWPCVETTRANGIREIVMWGAHRWRTSGNSEESDWPTCLSRGYMEIFFAATRRRRLWRKLVSWTTAVLTKLSDICWLTHSRQQDDYSEDEEIELGSELDDDADDDIIIELDFDWDALWERNQLIFIDSVQCQLVTTTDWTDLHETTRTSVQDFY